MKKLVLVAGLALGLSACSSNVNENMMTKEQLAGNWLCTFKFDDIGATAVENFNLNTNGSFSSKGLLVVKILPEEPAGFSYKATDEGTWNLVGNTWNIKYDINKHKVERASSKKLMNFIKADKELTETEQELFRLVSNLSEEDSNMDLEILNFDGKKSLDVKMKGESYVGKCVASKNTQAELEKEILN